MKRTRKLMVMLLAAAMLVMMVSGTAFAKKKGKVEIPTAGYRVYVNEQGQETQTTDAFTAKIDKSGRVVSVAYTGGISKTYSYSWKKDNLSRISYAENYLDDDGTPRASTYDLSISVKKKKPSTTVLTRQELKNGSATYRYTATSKYKWNKKDGSEAISGDRFWGDGDTDKFRDADVITLSKGRRSSEWRSNNMYTYNKNGTLKKYVDTSLDGKEWSIKEYDSNGFIQKEERHYSDNDWYKTEYTWTFDGKKPTSVKIVETNSYNGNWTEKWVFTASQAVKKARNCDAYGFIVWNGVPIYY